MKSTAKNGVERSRILFNEECPLTPEEYEILPSPWEILLVYTRKGRLHSTKLGKRGSCTVPDDIPLDAVLSHNHPSGCGPSIEDLEVVLEYPRLTMRAVTNNPAGKVEIWQFSAKEAMTPVEIKAIKEFYIEMRDENGGETISGNRKALELTMEEFPDKLKLINRIHP